MHIDTISYFILYYNQKMQNYFKQVYITRVCLCNIILYITQTDGCDTDFYDTNCACVVRLIKMSLTETYSIVRIGSISCVGAPTQDMLPHHLNQYFTNILRIILYFNN
jgi:hypothetical protein